MIEANEKDVALKYSLIHRYIGGHLFIQLNRMERAGKLEVQDKCDLLKKILLPENEMYYNIYKEGKITYDEFHTGDHDKFTTEEIIEFANNKEVDHLMEMVGCGTNRIAFRCKDFIIKFALDDLGRTDNKKEMFYSKRLQPYVTKVYECSKTGSISVQEYIRVLDLSEFDERRADMLEILEVIQKSYLFGDIGANTKNISNWGVRRDSDELCILDFAYIYKVDSSKFECFNGCKQGENGAPAYLRYDASYSKLVCPVCNQKYTFQDFKNIDMDMEKLELVSKQEERQFKYKGQVMTTTVGRYTSKVIKDPETGNKYKDYNDPSTKDMFYIIHKPEELVLRSKDIDTIKEPKEKKLSRRKLLRLQIERENLDELYYSNRNKYNKTIAEMGEKKYNKLFNTNFETGEEITLGKKKRKISKIKVDDWYDDIPREELLYQEEALTKGEITYDEWLAGDMSNHIPGVKVEDRGRYNSGNIRRNNNNRDTYDDIEDFLDDVTLPEFVDDNTPSDTLQDIDAENESNTSQQPVQEVPIQNILEPSNTKKKIVKTREMKFDIGGVYGNTKMSIDDGISKTVIDLTKDDLVVCANDGTKCMKLSNTIINRILTSYFPSAILSITEYNNIVRDKGVDKDRIVFIKKGNYILCYVMNRKSLTNFYGTLSSNYTETLSVLMNVYSNIAYKHEFYNKDNQLFDINNIETIYNDTAINEKDAFINFFKKICNSDLDNAICYEYDDLIKEFRSGMYYLTEDGYFMDSEKESSDNEVNVDISTNDEGNSEELPIIRREIDSDDTESYSDEDVDIDLSSLFGDDDNVSFEGVDSDE